MSMMYSKISWKISARVFLNISVDHSMNITGVRGLATSLMCQFLPLFYSFGLFFCEVIPFFYNRDKLIHPNILANQSMTPEGWAL